MQTSSSTELRNAWQAARSREPMARAFDVAKALGVSELELLGSHLGTPDVVRLTPDIAAILGALAGLGRVMALTRNPHAVIEKHGVWGPFSATGPIGLVHGDAHDALDLRLFLTHWHHALAVRSETPRGTRRSLQFFDRDGTAVHKVFLLGGEAQGAALDALIARHSDADQVTPPRVAPVPAEVEAPDGTIDVAGFQAAWAALADTHDFYPMTRRFGVTRTQALRLAPPGYARRVGVGSAWRVLEAAAATSLPIMVFVGNAGCLEIHSGPIARVKVLGPWLNVLDPGFDLHLREDGVAAAWVVTKPTADGPVTSLELFDTNDRLVAMFFGERKPGRPEDRAWRMLADAL